ncbi:MAG: gamma-glutamyltransferase, partial [Gammaproteobacteria bacterium]
IHLMAEAMKLAYSDRSRYLGDPDFFDVPARGLVSKEYAKRLNKKISLRKARPSKQIGPGRVPPVESPDTTHLSVMDSAGNAVVLTTTLNFSYGSGIVIRGTGMLMNNEMADFSAKAGVPNAFGLLGGEANQIEPGKRPLSSMAPSMLLRDGKPYLLTGSPGGSRILTTVLQMIVNVADFEMNVAEATMAPRVHHQWLPDKLYMEAGFSPDTKRLLQARGQNVVDSNSMGSLQSILYEEGYFYGASDTRRPGAAAVAAEADQRR